MDQRVTHLLLPGGTPELGTLVHIFHDASEDVEARGLVKDLRRVLAGSLELGDRRAEHLSPESLLSPRELEILRHLAHGMSTERIAAELVISPATVRNHIQRALNKLGAHSRLEAVAAAFRRRLL